MRFLTAVTITAASSFGSASATLQLLPLGGVPVTASNLLVNGSFEEPRVPHGNAIGGAGYPPKVGEARIGALAARTTSFTDSGLAPGTSYTYRVRVINSTVASDWSNEVTVTTPAGV